jgi:uncharacterized protein YmfQ (DUF2313 family)
MARSVDAYTKMLQALLPVGRIWNRALDSLLFDLLYGMAYEFRRVEGQWEELFIERDTRDTDVLLEEYEKEFAIPGPGETLATTVEQRRKDLHAKLLNLGRLNNTYYIDIADAMGYSISITEFTPAFAGVLAAGDACGMLSVMFYWIVNVLIEDGIRIDISNLKTILRDIKPAHTVVQFRFVGPQFATAFDYAFDSIFWYDGSRWPGRGTIYPGSFIGGMFSPAFYNNIEYDGDNLIGAYGPSFGQGLDRRNGGNYNYDDFGDGFMKPA